MRRIAIVAFDGVNLLDVAGPAQVFRTAAEQLIRTGAASAPAYEVVLLSARGGLILSSPGISLGTLALGRSDAATLDTLLVAGGHGAEAAAAEPGLVGWVKQTGGAVRRFGSICTGSFVLGAAGLLDGRKAATHWDYCAALRERFPGVAVDEDSIFVEDRGCWTSAGVTAGMDMALAMVEEDHGRELALLVAKRLVLFLKRPGGQSQFSSRLRAQSAEGPFALLLEWIVDNPSADLSVERLAERANMSLRNFYRAFTAATGRPPAQWVEAARLEVARRLLEQSGEPVDRIALRSGFGSPDRMRRVFSRRLGVSPAEYRQRFDSARAGRGGAGSAVAVLAAGR